MKAHFVCVSLVSLFACGGSALDVGSNQGGGPSEGDGGAAAGGSSAADGGKGGRQTEGGSVAKGGAAMGRGGEAVSMGAVGSASGGRTNGTAAASGLGAQMGVGGAMKASGGTGMTQGGSAGEPGATPPNALVPQSCSTMFQSVYEGDTLDFFFNPQNDKWRLTLLGSEADGRICGTATYIAAGQPAPPPATDPNESYPPGFDPMLKLLPGQATPGVTYSIIQGAEVSPALHFRISTNELWQDWCKLQTPVPQADGYSCVGGDGGWSSDGVTCTVTHRDGSIAQYPYEKCMLCLGPEPVCACDATHCVAADGSWIVFDLKHQGAQLAGTVGSTMITLDPVN